MAIWPCSELSANRRPAAAGLRHPGGCAWDSIQCSAVYRRVAQTCRSLHVCDEPERLKEQNRWQYGHAQNSAQIADIKKKL
jgi:hypothetical protein